MMRAQRLIIVVAASVLAGTVGLAQIGRTGTQWLTAFGDAQRTGSIGADDRISVEALSKPGFELQWKLPLDNQPRGVHGPGQGVTATGVTIFVPMSIVTGSSNTVYGIDNDIGYAVWKRTFDAALPAPSDGCPGGISAGATRIVPLTPAISAGRSGFGGGRGAVGFRSVLGEPGEGVPVEAPSSATRQAAPPPPAEKPPATENPAPAENPAPGAPPPVREVARAAAPAPPEAAPAPAPRAVPGQDPDRIPGMRPREPQTEAERRAAAFGYGFLFKPSGVAYVISSDGLLHVVGLPSGKDMQRPAPFLPANAKWSSPVAVGTMLYTATSGGCGGAPHAVWAIDLDSDAKPVVSWKTNGGPVVGAVAFTSGGTVIAAVGKGPVTGDGKANAIVALDPKTLQIRDWFSQPDADFATGPTVLRHGDREIVAAATRDGRIWLLDATSLGGADHATPLHVSNSVLGAGAAVSAEALAAWRSAPPPAPAPGSAAQAPATNAAADAAWILVPVAGAPAAAVRSPNGKASTGAVVALKLAGSGTAPTLEPAWASHDLAAPAPPLVVNGVVFALATGVPARAGGRGSPAVLHAYDGATGARLWTSGTAMASPASPGSLWAGYGQIYVGARDGTIYAFGFNDERSPEGSTEAVQR